MNSGQIHSLIKVYKHSGCCHLKPEVLRSWFRPVQTGLAGLSGPRPRAALSVMVRNSHQLVKNPRWYSPVSTTRPSRRRRPVLRRSAAWASRSVTLKLMFSSWKSSRWSSPAVTRVLYHAQVKHNAVLRRTGQHLRNNRTTPQEQQDRTTPQEQQDSECSGQCTGWV